MKFESIERLAHVCWCPHKLGDNLAVLGIGTSSQQLDYSFSSASVLEIFSLSLNDANLPVTKSLSSPLNCDARFQSIVWCNPQSDIIIGGLDNGVLNFYDVQQILNSDLNNAPCYSVKGHSGPVFCISVNNIQKSLLASCSVNAEIALWNLENLSAPCFIHHQTQSVEQVNSIAWNYQTGFVLGGASYNRCVLWDTRKLEPMLKFNDGGRSKHIAWNYSNAVQLFVASDDDSAPSIQLWDMRFAVSPVKLLNGQQRGTLCMAQVPHDPDLFLSSAKNNKILGWNMNLTNENPAEVVYDLPTTHWCFDLKCCPTIPGYFAMSSVDSKISFHNMLGETFNYTEAEQQSKKIAELFGLPSQPSLPVMKTEPMSNRMSCQLKCAPLWLKRTSRVTINFGGEIVFFTFENNSQARRTIQFSNVSNKTVVSDRACELYSSISANERLDDFFERRISRIEDDVWLYLKAALSKDKTSAFLELLMPYGDKIQPSNAAGGSVVSGLNNPGSAAIPGNDLELMKLLFNNDFNSIVDSCIASRRYADAILAGSIAGPSHYSKAVHTYFASQNSTFVKILQSIIEKDFESLIESASPNNWTYILSAILTFASDDSIYDNSANLISQLRRTGGDEADVARGSLITSICSGNAELFAQSLLSRNAEMDLDSFANVVEQAIIFTAALTDKTHLTSDAMPTFCSLILLFIFYLCEDQKFQEAYYFLSLFPDGVTELSYYKDLLARLLNVRQYSSQRQFEKKLPDSRNYVGSSRNTPVPQQVYTPPQAFLNPPISQSARNPFEHEVSHQKRDLSLQGYMNPGAVYKPTIPPQNIPYTPASSTTPPQPSQPFVQTAPTHWNDPPPLKSMENKAAKVSQPQTFASKQPSFFLPSDNPRTSVPEAIQSAPTLSPVAELSPQNKAIIDVFEALVHNCNAATRDYVTLRKIEEIHAKLGILYDKLRANVLSQTTVSQLYQFIGFMRMGDYNNAMSVYQHIISVADLAEIGSFISSIKSLLQISVNLKVLHV